MTFYTKCVLDFHIWYNKQHSLQYKINNIIREHPFNLKGGRALWFFWDFCFVCKFDWKKNSASEMGKNKYSVIALCALKKIVEKK